MIVFDLKCGEGHVFEAWFGSSGDYEGQQARGLVSCPLCGNGHVAKAVMAPAVSPKSNQSRRAAPASCEPAAEPMPMPASAPVPAAIPASIPVQNMPQPAQVRAVLEALARAQQEALRDSTWVGRQFADKARAMHYGEEDHSAIHGEVAPEEARALIEEGVEVAPLPFPVIPGKARN
ncbi:DUF1178 family protein [Sphingobium aquiterrae]|uniref:DUF1178 family protein n=1 Tax=Sphingobium aquiterrae TaxID=2038656 RepID=UPI00301A159E